MTLHRFAAATASIISSSPQPALSPPPSYWLAALLLVGAGGGFLQEQEQERQKRDNERIECCGDGNGRGSMRFQRPKMVDDFLTNSRTRRSLADLARWTTNTQRTFCDTEKKTTVSTSTTTSSNSNSKQPRTMFTKSLELTNEGSVDHDHDHDDESDGSSNSNDYANTEGDDYPNFSRHGASALLPQYLTREVYQQLKTKQTKNGVRLDDLIRSGVSLPFGARPPRGMAGVYAGDADSYRVFRALLLPLVQDNLHYPTTTSSSSQSQRQDTAPKQHDVTEATTVIGRLQRHESNLNYKQLLSHVLDPEGEYILYTRMRLARSIQGYRFAPVMSRSERRRVEALVKECVQELDANKKNKNNNNNNKDDDDDDTGKYLSVMGMSNAQHDDLIQRRILFADPDEFSIAAGLGRDWPDGRGIYCDTWQVDLKMPAIIIWCNAPEDHVWIISNAKGGDVQGVFTKLSQAVWALEAALKKRRHAFVEDRRLGFLNTSPANIGTALRASVYVKLVRLSQQQGFFDLIRRLRLEARSEYSENDKRFTLGIYDIANAEALGKSEVDLINVMIRGVGVLIELEKRLSRGEQVDLATVAV